MSIGVLIPHYNRIDLLKIVIPEWVKTTCDEIVIVDCNSKDGSVEYLEGFGDERIKIIELEKRMDFADAINAGMACTCSEWVLITNNDVYPKPDIFEVLSGYTRDKDLFSLDCYQSSWEGQSIHGYTILVGIFPLEHAFQYPDKPKEVLWGNMAGLLVSREKWGKLGGIDGKLKLDFDDVDVCIRAWNRKWKTVYVPSAVLYHKRFASYSVDAGRLYHAYKNALMLCYRYIPRKSELVTLNLIGYTKLILKIFLREQKLIIPICRATTWFVINFAYVRSKREPCQKILYFWRAGTRRRA